VNKFGGIAILAGSFVGAFAAPALAIPTKAFYTGNFYNTNDVIGTFGHHTATGLNGPALNMVFTFDPSRPTVNYSFTAPINRVDDGFIYYVTSAMPIATITIGAHSEVLSGFHDGDAAHFNNADNNVFAQFNVEDYFNQDAGAMGRHLLADNPQYAALSGGGSKAPSRGGGGGGGGGSSGGSGGSGSSNPPNGGGGGGGDGGGGGVSAVPLPTSLPLLAISLCLAGATSGRRKKRT
jgi:hypothetical protein